MGTGGREHALARALVRTSDSIDLVLQAGNPGMEACGRAVAFTADDPVAVARVAREEGVDLVVVGPEAPLVAGVADAVVAAGIPCFGPSAAAAELEGSKSFAKEVMEAAGVATARSHTCRTMDQVEAALADLGAPHVVKDDALAAGKGVVVTQDLDLARAHAARCLAREDGAVVIEDYLDGPEVSLFCICDGQRAVPLVPAQDFKRLCDADEGPNTGGMGAYTPLPWLSEGVVEEVVDTVALPTLAEMARRGTPFRGLLYCGLALTRRGVRVVEFNVRFGDPETQVVLERLESSLADLLLAAATGRLDTVPIPTWSPDAAVTVVIASPGYPEAARTGGVITGVGEADALPGVHVIHAGTKLLPGTPVSQSGEPSPVGGAPTRSGAPTLVSAGGRVLDVVGRGPDIEAARAAAYAGVRALHLEGAQYRTDIATWPDDLRA